MFYSEDRATFQEATQTGIPLNRHSGSFVVDASRLTTNFITLIPSLTFIELKVVSIEHLQWVWHASREGFPLRTPGSVLIRGPLYDLIVDTSFPTLHRINGRTELDLYRIKRSFHWSFATGVACQQGVISLPDTWLSRPFWDLLELQLLRPDSSSLSCLYSTFHLNGHRNADKRANSFSQFLHSFPRNSSCLYYVGRETKCADCLDPVLSVLKFIINIDCL